MDLDFLTARLPQTSEAEGKKFFPYQDRPKQPNYCDDIFSQMRSRLNSCAPQNVLEQLADLQ